MNENIAVLSRAGLVVFQPDALSLQVQRSARKDSVRDNCCASRSDLEQETHKVLREFRGLQRSRKMVSTEVQVP